MKYELTKGDRDLWSRTTKDVRPLGKASVSPCEGHRTIGALTPRNEPYDPVMDLHGYTVHEAHGMVDDHIYQGIESGYKQITVITGRSGQINQELPRWLEGHRQVRSVSQKSNGGSWLIVLRRDT
jgi:DNA-nicking Smr family endonuclease